jgi:hypothetical protein
MKMKLLVAVAAIAGGVMAMGAKTPATAHHAFSAEFDADLPVALRGPITRVEWINPHSWIHIMHENEDGSEQAWMAEGGTPNTLLRRGINRNSLQIGTELVITGYQSKDRLCTPACRANGRDITFPDGTKLFMGSSGIGAPRDGSDPTEGP